MCNLVCGSQLSVGKPAYTCIRMSYTHNVVIVQSLANTDGTLMFISVLIVAELHVLEHHRSFMHTHVHTYMHTHTQTHMHTVTHTHPVAGNFPIKSLVARQWPTNIHTHTYTHMHTHTLTHSLIHTCDMHTLTHTHTHTHTRTHAHTVSLPGHSITSTSCSVCPCLTILNSSTSPTSSLTSVTIDSKTTPKSNSKRNTFYVTNFLSLFGYGFGCHSAWILCPKICYSNYYSSSESLFHKEKLVNVYKQNTIA